MSCLVPVRCIYWYSSAGFHHVSLFHNLPVSLVCHTSPLAIGFASSLCDDGRAHPQRFGFVQHLVLCHSRKVGCHCPLEMIVICGLDFPGEVVAGSLDWGWGILR